MSARPDFSELDRRVQGWVESGYYPGAGLIIGHGDRILHERYFGDQNARSVVHVASAGKWVAAATIAAVVDAGGLSWDEPAGQRLPELTGDLGRATLRQLLSHTAGYPDYQPAGARRDDYQTLAEAVAHIAVLAPTSRPGTEFKYGGLGMQVAGRMAELATGESFEALFQGRIAGPLGLTLAGFTPVSTEEGFGPMLAGGYHTSLGDYGRFLEMISGEGVFRGRRVLSPAAISALEADQMRQAGLGPGGYVDLARADPRHDVYGLGEWREEVEMDGAVRLISSPGWAGAYPWIDKSRGVWGFILAKANVPRAKADGFSTFMSGSVAPLLVRDALDDSHDPDTRRRYVDVPGARLYVEERGAGAALILLHGHSLDRTMWDPQMAALSRRYRVIRYDLRGYGRSSAPREDQPFLHTDDLRALMDRLEIERAHVAGLSLGGFVAVDFLALHPDRLASVIAASGDIFDVPGPDEPWTPKALAARRQEIAKLKADGVQAFKRTWFDALVSHGGSRREALRAPLWTMISKWQAWQPLHVEPRLVLGRAALPRLRTNRPSIPVLILRGDLDPGGEQLLAVVGDGRKVVIPDCGHVANIEAPEAFTSAMIDFLKSTGQRASARRPA